MKKAIISIILTVSLLFSFAVVASSENTLKVNASNYIPDEVSGKLKTSIDYDYAIRIYVVGMYFHDLVDGKTLDEIMSDAPVRYFAVKGSADEAAYGIYTYRNGEVQKFVEAGTPDSETYEWLKDTVSATTLSIEGIGDKPITNVYCLRTYSPPRASVIVYQTTDATYYAWYRNGMHQEPLYMAEDAFMAYAHAYVAEYRSRPQYDENGEPLYWSGGVSVDPSGFETLTVTLKSEAINNEVSVDPTVDNSNSQEEKKVHSVKVIIVVSSVICVLAIAVITVLLVKRKRSVK